LPLLQLRVLRFRSQAAISHNRLSHSKLSSQRSEFKDLISSDDPERVHTVPLIAKQPLSSNSNVLSFALSSSLHRLGIRVGQHIYLKANVDGTEITRPYTPVSHGSTLGQFDLAVKMYEKGKMSMHVNNLKIGDTIALKGPLGSFVYDYQSTERKTFCMIAGGSGITPLLQITRAVLENPEDSTLLKLIFCNVTEEDIMFRQELDKYAATRPEQFQVHYVLDKPPQNWMGSTGYITTELLREQFGADFQQHSSVTPTKLLFCGPQGMIRAIVREHIPKLKLSPEMYYRF